LNNKEVLISLNKIIIIVFLFSLIASCKEKDQFSGGYFGDILGAGELNVCEAVVGDHIVDVDDSGETCINYNEDFYRQYGDDNYRKQFVAFQRKAGTKDRIKNFRDFIVPMCVMGMRETGYPASACIAQSTIESGWGQSKLFLNHNNLFGQMCGWSGTRKKVVFQGTAYERETEAHCTLSSFSTSDGHKKAQYDTPMDSVREYLDNLLYNPRTANTSYSRIRSEVARAKREGRKPDLKEIIAGLSDYATGAGYQAKVAKAIKDGNLEKYDDIGICGQAYERKLGVKDCDKIDSSSRDLSQKIKNIENESRPSKGSGTPTIER